MTTSAPSGERQTLEAAVQAAPQDPQARVRLAQFVAKAWVADPTTDLTPAIQHLDAALAFLPAEQHAGVGQFVRQLHQRGAPLGPILQSGAAPRLAALLSGQPVPSAAAPAAAPQAAPRPATPVPQAPPAQAAPVAQASAPSASADATGRIRLRAIDPGPVTMQRVKEWLDGSRLEELTAAFPMIDNFRTRRVVIDKLAESATPLGAACLVKVLTTLHDENLANEIRKKLLTMDTDMVTAQVEYSPSDPGRGAAVALLAVLKTEGSVEPLSNALGDVDPGVRASAVTGLAAMIDPSQDWIEHLMAMVRTDPDAGVRMAAARALQAIDTKEVFNLLDMASQDPNFDPLVKPVVEALRERHGSGRAAKLKTQASEEKGPGLLGGLTGRDIAFIVGGIAVIVLVGFFISGSVKQMAQPVTLPPMTDEKRNSGICSSYKAAVESNAEINRLAAAEGMVWPTPTPLPPEIVCP